MVLSVRIGALGLMSPLRFDPTPVVLPTRALTGNRMPERGSVLLSIPASRAGKGAGAAEGGAAAAFGRLAGEATGDFALQGGTSVPPGK